MVSPFLLKLISIQVLCFIYYAVSPHIAFAVEQMHELIDSFKAGKVDLKARILQLEHEQDERVK